MGRNLKSHFRVAMLVMSLMLAPARSTKNGVVTVSTTYTEQIDVETLSGDGPFRLEIAMGAGTLTLNPGAGSKLVQGTVVYNIDEFKPTVTTSGNTVRIEQGKTSIGSHRGNIKNDWNLNIGDAPLALKLSAGATKGNVELGGLSLTDLDVAHGASDFTMSFSQPNKILQNKLSIDAGAARTVFNDLANANAEKMTISGGAGDLRLGFGGTLQRDLQVNVTAAAGNVVITVPAGTSALATVTGMMSSVTTSGDWSRSGGGYAMQGSGPTITLSLMMSVGKVDLRSS
jgi:hypothetical protein